MSTDQKKNKILVIEDELHIAEGLRLNLGLRGHSVKVANNGELGLEYWKSWQPDLIVLDLMMPKMDGYAFLKKVRSVTDYLPIIILSAKFDANDKVECFENGVDDYLTKPFSLEEFFLRIDRLLKKSKWVRQDKLVDINNGNESSSKVKLSDFTIFTFGSNKVDFVQGKAFSGRDVINLTYQEIKLLRLFFSNEGRPLSRNELLMVGLNYQGEINSRTVDNFVARFRKYFEKDTKNPVFFKGLRSVGYVFVRQGELESDQRN